MTKKEQIFDEYKKVRAEYWEIIGKADNKFNDKKVYQCNTIDDLKDEIGTYTYKINLLLSEKRVAEWKKSEEGIAHIKAIDNELNNTKNDIDTLYKYTEDYLKGIIHKELGTDWDIDFSKTFSTIGLVESYYPNGKPKFIFGHTFELHYDYYYKSYKDDTKEFKVKVNYGTLGEFCVDEQPSRVKLIQGIDCIVSNNDVIFKIKDLLRNFTNDLDFLTEKARELTKQKENPPMTKIA